MNNITYGITEERYSLRGDERTAYDIACYADDDMTVISSVRDVFCDKAEAESFAALLNELELSPSHLEDVVQDHLER